MMYNLTYLGHRVTLPWLDLRSNFDLDLSRSNYTWFDAPWRETHDGIKIGALPLKLKILSSKNRSGKFWNFDPWWRQFWPETKNDRNGFEMIFLELSNAVFRFVLRCAGAEIDGGVFKHPPPSRSWEIQRPSRARVKPLPNQCFIFLKLALKYVILPFLCSSSVYIILSVYFEQRQLCLETGIICVYGNRQYSS